MYESIKRLAMKTDGDAEGGGNKEIESRRDGNEGGAGEQSFRRLL